MRFQFRLTGFLARLLGFLSRPAGLLFQPLGLQVPPRRFLCRPSGFHGRLAGLRCRPGKFLWRSVGFHFSRADGSYTAGIAILPVRLPAIHTMGQIGTPGDGTRPTSGRLCGGCRPGALTRRGGDRAIMRIAARLHGHRLDFVATGSISKPPHGGTAVYDFKSQEALSQLRIGAGTPSENVLLVPTPAKPNCNRDGCRTKAAGTAAPLRHRSARSPRSTGTGVLKAALKFQISNLRFQILNLIFPLSAFRFFLSDFAFQSFPYRLVHRSRICWRNRHTMAWRLARLAPGTRKTD